MLTVNYFLSASLFGFVLGPSLAISLEALLMSFSGDFTFEMPGFLRGEKGLMNEPEFFFD